MAWAWTLTLPTPSTTAHTPAGDLRPAAAEGGTKDPVALYYELHLPGGGCAPGASEPGCNPPSRWQGPWEGWGWVALHPCFYSGLSAPTPGYGAA